MRLPDDLVRRLALAGSRGQAVWEEARAARDWERFRPCLEEIVALKREQADLLGHDGEAYDALMDAYEPGMRTARVEPLFAALADELQTLLGRSPTPGRRRRRRFAGARSPTPSSGTSRCGSCATSASTSSAGRQDRSAHPFTTSIALHDIRVTTRIDEADPFSARSPRRCTRRATACTTRASTPTTGHAHRRAPSLGLHESQSRLWENLVGRSRPFWQHYTPVMQEMFGEAMADATPTTSTAR